MEEQINNDETTKIEQPTEKKKTKFFDKIKMMFLIWNIFSLAIYTTYTLYSIYHKTTSPALTTAVWVLLIVYALTFICLIAFGVKNKIQLKANLKNYKSALSILKKFIKILNLALSVITAVNIFYANGKLDLFNIIFGVIAISIAGLSIFFEIIKMIIRKKLAKRKERKLKLKEKNNI